MSASKLQLISKKQDSVQKKRENLLKSKKVKKMKLSKNLNLT